MCDVVCCSACCSVLQCVVAQGSYLFGVCCSVLQCVAVCCSVLQCVAAQGGYLCTETWQNRRLSFDSELSNMLLQMG